MSGPQIDPIILRARELREMLHLTQREFAERFGLKFQTYAQWERGHRRPDETALVLLRVIVAAPGIVAAIVKEG